MRRSRRSPRRRDAGGAALACARGPVHAELRWNERGPWLVEVAGRSIGGLCSKTLRFGAGTARRWRSDPAPALGLGWDAAARERQASGVMMIPIRAPGCCARVAAKTRRAARPLVEGLEITARLNQPWCRSEGDSYLGFVFARARA